MIGLGEASSIGEAALAGRAQGNERSALRFGSPEVEEIASGKLEG
jgi:hypothetical protein